MRFPIFLSVVLVVANNANELDAILTDISETIAELVSDYELIVVDNASNDESLATLKKLTSENGLPNLQIYALTKKVDPDTASWVGLENALGDFVAVIDPMAEDVHFVSSMLDEALGGADVVFATNRHQPQKSLAYQASSYAFNVVYELFNGVNLARDAPQYRVLSKRVVNFLLQHPQPGMTYRHLPATGGFARANLTYSAVPKTHSIKTIGESVDRGMRLLVSTTRAPMRVVTGLSLIGALSNIAYSIYVIGSVFIRNDIAPGWASLSLQQSGMFFLISLVLFVLGEYILHMGSTFNREPLYHVGQEFTSARMTRREKLNIEEATPSRPLAAQQRSLS